MFVLKTFCVRDKKRTAYMICDIKFDIPLADSRLLSLMMFVFVVFHDSSFISPFFLLIKI